MTNDISTLVAELVFAAAIILAFWDRKSKS